MSKFQDELNKKLQEQIKKYEDIQSSMYDPQTEAIYAGYNKLKAPNGISKLSLQAPHPDKAIQRSNYLVSALKENRILFFSIMMSFFFFGAFAPNIIGASVFVVYCIVIALEHYIFKKSKAHDSVMLVLASAAYPFAHLSTVSYINMLAQAAL